MQRKNAAPPSPPDIHMLYDPSRALFAQMPARSRASKPTATTDFMTTPALLARLLLPLLFALAGCATVSAPPAAPVAQVVLHPALSPALAAALAQATMCESPVPARYAMSKSFKYGCFCGANHPAIAHPSGKAEADLDAGEREELVAQYYRIKPVDEIDAICQAHDVCWIARGGPALACNDAFEASMARLQQRLRAEVSGVGQTNTRQWRCVQLARDMRMAARFVMRRQLDENGSPTGNYLSQVAASPAVAAYATLYGAGHLLDLYPHADERCQAAP
jgi:hypothetical protein